MFARIKKTILSVIAIVLIAFITLVVLIRVTAAIVASEPERVSAWVESVFDVRLDYQKVDVKTHLDALHFDVQYLSFSTETVDFSAESLQFDVRVFESILQGRFFGHEFGANQIRFSALTSDDDESDFHLSAVRLPWAVVRLKQLEGDIHRDDGLWQLYVDDLISSTYKPFAGNAQIRLKHNHVSVMDRLNFSFAQVLGAHNQFRFWTALTGLELSDSLSSHWVVHGLADLNQGLASGALFATLNAKQNISFKSDWFWNSDEAVTTNFLLDQLPVKGQLSLQWPYWIEQKKVAAQIEGVDLAELKPLSSISDDFPIRLSGDVSQMSLVYDVQNKDWTGSKLGVRGLSVELPEFKGLYVKQLNLDAYASQSSWSGVLSRSKTPTQLFIPQVFSNPLILQDINLPFELDVDSLGLSVDEADLKGTEWGLYSNVRMKYLPTVSDVDLDVELKINDVKTQVAHYLLPDRILSPMAVKWVREHIRGGEVRNATVRLKGTGQSLARVDHPEHDSYFAADIVGAALEDLPEQWADIVVDSGKIEVIDGDTSVYVARAKTHEIGLTGVEAQIYQGERHTRLSVIGHAVAQNTSLINWMKDSPLNDRLGLDVNEVTIDGTVAGAVELDLALIDGDDDSKVRASLDVNNVNLKIAGIEMTNAVGQLEVTESNVQAENLKVAYKNQPFEVSIRTEEGVDKVINVHAKGLLDGGDWHSSLSGVVPVEGDVFIPWSKGDLRVLASSQLEQLSINLPFYKKTVNEILSTELKAARKSGLWEINVTAGSATEIDVIEETDRWNIQVDSPTVEGTVSYSDFWVNADFKRMDLFSDTTERKCTQEVLVSKGQKWRIKVGRLKKDQRDFGKFELNMTGKGEGYEIVLLKLTNQSAVIEMQGHLDLEQNQTNLMGELRSESLYDVAQWAGINSTSVTASKVNGYVSLNWRGGLECISVKTLKGKGEWVLKDGNIESAEPGLGRLIGLLNFESIKRRLLFDLTDVMGKGLGYDRIWSQVSIQDGILSVNQLKVEAPSSKLEMWGQVNLLDSIYDLKAKVKPNIRNAAVTIGAIAGGPAGAVVGWLGERVMKLTGVSKVVEYDYSITGSFDAPKVEAVD